MSQYAALKRKRDDLKEQTHSIKKQIQELNKKLKPLSEERDTASSQLEQIGFEAARRKMNRLYPEYYHASGNMTECHVCQTKAIHDWTDIDQACACENKHYWISEHYGEDLERIRIGLKSLNVYDYDFDEQDLPAE